MRVSHPVVAGAICSAALVMASVSVPVLPSPTRELEWKEVNILSLSDTHGWLLGHQHATWPEPNYSGDYGAFASFVTRMRDIAEQKGVDLLLVDAGDHHDGSGLVSSSPASAVAADNIFNQLRYDVLTIGNHELYSYDTAKWIYDNRARWGGRYLTSNANITVEEDGQTINTPIADRFVKFETTQGRRVTAFGVIFNFQAHSKGTTIQPPTEMAKEAWFLQAVLEAPDYFVLVGHMPARFETAEWKPVFEAIRRIHPHVPVYIFGGHTHVRDCTQYDPFSIAVVPGRYMETVAFTSSSLTDHQEPSKPLKVARRYMDANRKSYAYHTDTNLEAFDLPIGMNITSSLLQLASSLNISKTLGVAPSDLFMARYPYGHPKSIFTEWGDHVLPATVYEERRSKERLIITQTGSLRFDLFQGSFSRNDELTLSPFENAFLYTPLPVSMAQLVVAQLNRARASKLVPARPNTKWDEDQRVERVYQEWLTAQSEGHDSIVREHRGDQAVLGAKRRRLTMGYVTRDNCPGKGDDIEHEPLPRQYKVPDFIGSPFPAGLQDEDEIDVIVMDFALDDFLAAVKVLDPSRGLRAEDMKAYAEGTKLNAVWGEYAEKRWQP